MIMQGEGYTLYKGDCLEVMAGLNGPVDAIIADLPYGTTACEWDSVIPLAPLWTQFKQLIKPNGAIVLFASFPFSGALWASNPAWFKYELIWNKTRGSEPQLANVRPQKAHENILIFGQGRLTYNPQMEKRDKPIFRGKLPGHRPNSRTDGRGLNILASPSFDRTYDSRFPLSVVCFSNSDQANKFHPTQKPLSLLAYLICTYTNPGETVLDCTMGSGTTIVAAIQEGRKGVGIELDSGYFDISVKRCADASRAARGLPKQLRDDRDYADMPLFTAAAG